MRPHILIAGPSASGKTTLARAVASRLCCPCLSLDELFIRGAKVMVDTPSGPVRSYERPELYNGNRLAMRLFNGTGGVGG